MDQPTQQEIKAFWDRIARDWRLSEQLRHMLSQSGSFQLTINVSADQQPRRKIKAEIVQYLSIE